MPKRDAADRYELFARAQRPLGLTAHEPESCPLKLDPHTPLNAPHDLVFVALDFEAKGSINPPLITDVGIAKPSMPAISALSHLVLTAPPSLTRSQPTTCGTNTHSCPANVHFGNSIALQRSILESRLRDILKFPSSSSSDARAMGLVGHSLHSDITYLSSLGIALGHLDVKNKIDTRLLCFYTSRLASLEVLLKKVDLEHL
ncbi:Inositol polyphosphate 5-phosphatase OCRL-1 [Sphaceloma murrayae]|uniref:Inositol polyphosphate 5-phosphatase OCRL-1 n=1 Tax=Sphaceloma murrayae TaxID=2082308 RepID=A0A2K1QIU3_9PEZI|nr:Inositol polyphosphate 5-phosphatase OCRL-1 [Sphaceloma murrayae]